MFEEYKIATLGSHSALQILKGAKEEGFKTVCICLKGNEKPYESFRVADEMIIIDSYKDFFSIEKKLIDKNAILIPHASMIAYLGMDYIQSMQLMHFGNKNILSIEAHRVLQKQWLEMANLKIPKHFSSPETIDRLCITKFHGADGGRGYFLAKDAKEFYTKLAQSTKEYYIQEYVVGIPIYIHYFYSPLTNEIEVLGFDKRYEANVDGIGRIAAKDQLACEINSSYTVGGNSPVVIRESLLPEVFAMGEAVIKASQQLTPGGLFGPFCLETILNSDLKFYVFEISARIVAGTNVFMNGSPYSYLRYNEPMNTGRRIAREIKQAILTDSLSKVLG